MIWRNEALRYKKLRKGPVIFFRDRRSTRHCIDVLYILCVITIHVRLVLLAAALLTVLATQPAYANDSYKYFRIGNKEDVQTKAAFGIAMIGGGKDLDEAFRWLCNKGNGGDFLIIRARGSDA